jgi:hypothetical protein
MLDGAANWLERNGVVGITSRELLTQGAYGRLQIYLPLTCAAKTLHKDVTAQLHGVYILPVKPLLELEASQNGANR